MLTGVIVGMAAEEDTVGADSAADDDPSAGIKAPCAATVDSADDEVAAGVDTEAESEADPNGAADDDGVTLAGPSTSSMSSTPAVGAALALDAVIDVVEAESEALASCALKSCAAAEPGDAEDDALGVNVSVRVAVVVEVSVIIEPVGDDVAEELDAAAALDIEASIAITSMEDAALAVALMDAVELTVIVDAEALLVTLAARSLFIVEDDAGAEEADDDSADVGSGAEVHGVAVSSASSVVVVVDVGTAGDETDIVASAAPTIADEDAEVDAVADSIADDVLEAAVESDVPSACAATEGASGRKTSVTFRAADGADEGAVLLFPLDGSTAAAAMIGGRLEFSA